ncbi:MAG: hypothetical protein ACOYOS_15320, partial [Syntrophales bacterium]
MDEFMMKGGREMVQNMKMGAKIRFVLALMALAVLITGMVGIVGMSQLNQSRDEIARITLPGITGSEMNKEAQTAIQKGESTFALLKGMLIAVMVLSIVLAIAVGIRFTRDVTDIIAGLKEEVRRVVKACAGGNSSMRGDPEKVNHEFSDIIKGFNDTINSSIETTAEQGKVAQKVAAGDLTVQLPIRSEQDIVAISMNTGIASLNNLRNEINRLANASQEGMLPERGRPEEFRGVYAEIVRGVNELLDAVTLPVTEGNRIIGLICDGNLREKFEIACKGDHERMKEAINGLHAFLGELVACVTRIAHGDLTAKVPKVSERDQIHGCLALLENNIQALVADTSMLSKAVVDKDFAIRADAAKHQGDFQQIILNIHEILDAVNEQLKVAAEYRERIFRGEVSPKVSDDDKVDPQNIFLEMIARNKPYF